MTDIERAYLDVIEDAMTRHPRSQQKVIGPSEIGIECDKRVLYKLAGVAEPARPPAWKPAIGTAVHAQLEEWFDRANQVNPATGEVTNWEWVTESRVYVGDIGTQKVFGSVDLFHVPSGTVLDHKIVGTRQLQWDDLEGILVSDIVADTTPLTKLDEVTCILIGWPTYILEATITGTRRLSLRTPRTMGMSLPHPIAVLPHHRCGARQPGVLTTLTKPEPDQLTDPPF